MHEFRHILRFLLKSPGFAAVAIVSLALGIGANTAIFSLLNAVALRTLATPEPHRLAGLFTVDRAGERENFSYTDFERIRQHQRSFSSLFPWIDAPIRTFEVDGVLFPGGALIAGDGFAETMRLQPILGRGLIAGDGDVAVLGYQCWRRYFQGTATALGKTIRVQGKLCTVVGVAPEGFTNMEGSGPVDVIVPLSALWPVDRLRGDPNPGWGIAGRLKPGVTLEHARAEMVALWQGVRRDGQLRIEVESAARGTGFNFPRERFMFPLQILMAIVGLLLLLSSVNLATLLLARADAKQRETGIRLALGAGRMRILRRFLAESLLLAGAGSLIGVIFARWVARFFAQFVWVSNNPRARDVPFDWNVLAFTIAVTVVSGLFFGLFPAVRMFRTDPSMLLRQESSGSGRAGRNLKLLVVVQVALSFVLVVAATLFTGTLRNLRSIPLGFDSAQVLGMQLIERPQGYRGMNAPSYYRELHERLARVPGVGAVSSSALPPVLPVTFPDHAVKAGPATANANVFPVGPRYFETMRIPLVAGREFTFHDGADSPMVAIISESLARRLFPSMDAVGRSVTVSDEDPSDLIVAGVVRDSYTGSLQKHNPMQLFRSVFQLAYGARSPYVLVRSAGPTTTAFAQRLRTEVEALGREYPVRIETMDRAIARALTQERMMAMLAGSFGLLALLLAAMGMYGLMSYAMVRRRRDIGIRMALGAGQRTIVSMVLRESLILVVAGFALSAPAVYAGSKLVSTMLYGLRPLDAAPLALAAGVLLATALVAVYVPARRAAKADPLNAIRSEG